MSVPKSTNDSSITTVNDLKNDSNLPKKISPEEEAIRQSETLLGEKGYYHKYMNTLKGKLSSEAPDLDAWYTGVDFDQNSVKISKLKSSSFVVEYKAKYTFVWTVGDTIDDEMYFDETYLFKEKVVKSNGKWTLKGPIGNPKHLKDLDRKRWYSTYTNKWYDEPA